jgi:hypothetical protein
MNPEGVTHAPLYLAITVLLSAARVMTLGRKIGARPVVHHFFVKEMVNDRSGPDFLPQSPGPRTKIVVHDEPRGRTCPRTWSWFQTLLARHLALPRTVLHHGVARPASPIQTDRGRRSVGSYPAFDDDDGLHCRPECICGWHLP